MDDARIIELYWQRSDKAIAETAKKFGAYLHTVAYNILGSGEDAEECVNDTYLGAWNSMPDKRPRRLSAYLARIARNFAVSRAIEKNRLKRGGGETPAALDELAECVPGGTEPERELERRELGRAISAFLASLPEVERNVFVARYFFLAPTDEIAEKFGFTRSKTAAMLRRTRIRLKNYVTEEGLL